MKWGAHTHHWSSPWPGLEQGPSQSRAQCSTTELFTWATLSRFKLTFIFSRAPFYWMTAVSVQIWLRKSFFYLVFLHPRWFCWNVREFERSTSAAQSTQPHQSVMLKESLFNSRTKGQDFIVISEMGWTRVLLLSLLGSAFLGWKTSMLGYFLIIPKWPIEKAIWANLQWSETDEDVANDKAFTWTGS